MNSVVVITAGAVLLGAIIVWGIVTRRRRAGADILLPDLDRVFAELSRSTSPKQATLAVAAVLENDFGADRLAFIRKQNRALLTEFVRGGDNRAAQLIRIPPQPDLIKSCTQSYSPRRLEVLRIDAGEASRRALDKEGYTYFLPIFWNTQFYGLFLMRLPATFHGSMNGLMGALAHSLSAVYHLHLRNPAADHSGASEVASKDTKAGHTDDATHPARQILRLVRHRNSELVVRKLISAAQSEIGIERFVFVYEPKDKSEEMQLIAGGVGRPVRIPTRELFGAIARHLSTEHPIEIGSVEPKSAPAGALSRELTQNGLSHALLFPLSSNRRGIFCWGDKKPAGEITRRLSFFHAAAHDLIENAESFERVEELSQTDPLTGLFNQRFLHARLAEETNRARRYGRTLGLVMIDVDLLKAVNDVYGHQAGDAIICQIGRLLRSSVREIDIIARYGGDEFCVVMPEADLSTCELFMTRIRTWLATTKLTVPTSGAELYCTISLGAAVFPDHAADAQKLIFAADMALLKAKEQGRNTSQVYNRE